MSDNPNTNNLIRLEGAPDPVLVSSLTQPLPTDRIFRNAWRLNGNVASVDVNLARPIVLERIRAKRAEKFPDLDSLYLRADEAGDTAKKQAIAAKKQVLRDITKDARIANATDAAGLKVVVETITAEIAAA